MYTCIFHLIHLSINNSLLDPRGNLQHYNYYTDQSHASIDKIDIPYVNREIFVVKIFSYSVLATKIKHVKFNRMRTINVNVHGKGSPTTKII